MTLNCKGKILDLSTPIVMGVININDDSFFSGSRVSSTDLLISQARKMIEEGATIIDIGAMSSRPGAELIDPSKESDIIGKSIEALSQFDTIISVDTVWSSTAEVAINAGAHIINDISAGLIDIDMLDVVGKYKNVPMILMHMVGNPQNMQSNNQYNNLILDMLKYFSTRIRLAKNEGITDVIIDPGFGFSKDISQNYKILNNLSNFSIFDAPILAGLSRKSMLYKLLETTPEDALNASTSANTIALMNGAKILRVHDVKEAMEVVKIFNKLKDSSN